MVTKCSTADNYLFVIIIIVFFVHICTCLHFFVCLFCFPFCLFFFVFFFFIDELSLPHKNVPFFFQVMPFSLTQGGKCVAHVLQKHKPKRALVFVRAKGE